MDKTITEALDNSWHQQAARSSLDRWLSICESEKWQVSTAELASMVKVFGASWYFTRFIYFYGIRVMDCFTQDEFAPKFDKLLSRLSDNTGEIDDEDSLRQLRIGKNKAMLYVLVNYLEERINQRTMEQALTRIADQVIIHLLDLSGLSADGDNQILVLGMGSLAGHEMNYGSDLDMIFLARSKDKHVEELAGKARRILRLLPLHEPSGYLYDIDMRLRPHGSSGTLITSFERFIEFHQADKDVWQRQMMTRHRCIYGDRQLAGQLETLLTPAVYQHYSEAALAAQIKSMRMRVERELGRPRGKYEIKRGIGGIMDIDFLTHYFQLLHGHRHRCLQTCSTRKALQQIDELQLLQGTQAKTLSHAYDHLKRVECALRVFDMRPISQFINAPEAVVPIARALGHRQASDQCSAAAFLDEYQGIANQVRGIFNQVFSRA